MKMAHSRMTMGGEEKEERRGGLDIGAAEQSWHGECVERGQDLDADGEGDDGEGVPVQGR